MNTNQLRAAGMGAAFLIMFLSGFWLNRTGKPYGTIIFSIHKFVGVGMGVILFTFVKQAHEAVPFNTIEIAAVVSTVLFLLPLSLQAVY